MSETSNGPGFVAIYRWRVEPEHEAAFVERWRQATAILSRHGGQGSLLGRAQSGELVAVALWPSAEARDRAFADAGNDAPWPPTERLDPILVDPIANLWSHA